MRLFNRPHRVAGLLALLAAGLAAAIWYVYLFVANPPDRPLWDSVLGHLSWAFSLANGDRWWFIWLAALPLASAAVGAGYLLNLAHSRSGAVILFALSLVLAASALFLTNWALAFFVALPAVFGWRCIHSAPGASHHRSA